MLRKIGLAILSCVLLINTIGLSQSSAQTKEEILWLITEFDDSLRDHDTDRNVSLFMELSPGLNMVSLPLKPQTPYTARSLAAEIGATVVIKYDEALGRFVGFTSGSSGDGFPIEGGKGYIVNVLEGKTLAFTGAAWTNEPSAEAAPPVKSASYGWAFIVSGAMTDGQGSDYTVTVRNLRTGAVATDSIGDSRFNVTINALNVRRDSQSTNGDFSDTRKMIVKR